MIDADDHLEGYQIKGVARHLPRTVRVTDQFGVLFLDPIKADRLLVPSGSSLPPLPPPGALADIDHYKFYFVKRTRGTARFVPQSELLGNQFEEGFVDVKKPTRLCTPVDKNEEGIVDTVLHLMCYQIKRSAGEPKHVKREGVNVINPFGQWQRDTIKEEELCVPALKAVLP